MRERVRMMDLGGHRGRNWRKRRRRPCDMTVPQLRGGRRAGGERRGEGRKRQLAIAEDSEL
jgi:hypothetical protein